MNYLQVAPDGPSLLQNGNLVFQGMLQASIIEYRHELTAKSIVQLITSVLSAFRTPYHWPNKAL